MRILFNEHIVTIQVRYFDYEAASPPEIERDFRTAFDVILDEDDGDEVIAIKVEPTGNQRVYGEEN